MKRFIVFVVLLLLVSWIMARHRWARRPVLAPRSDWEAPERAYDSHDKRRFAVDGSPEIQRALASSAADVVSEPRSEFCDTR